MGTGVVFAVKPWRFYTIFIFFKVMTNAMIVSKLMSQSLIKKNPSAFSIQ